MATHNDLDRCAYDVADEYRSGRWHLPADDRGGKKWRETWDFLIDELARRCPGLSRAEYEKALNHGFLASR